jgi:integrase
MHAVIKNGTVCHEAGGELEQIQFLLGHASVLTTERYTGCRQRLNRAVNDRIALHVRQRKVTWQTRVLQSPVNEGNYLADS